MLKEITQVRQIRGEPRRRWFSSACMDLVVWCDDDDKPIGFQLCYDKGKGERALNWNLDSGYSHMSVDDGESTGGLQHKRTPILLVDGEVDMPRLKALFMDEAQQLPWQVVTFVSEKIHGYQTNVSLT